MPQWKQYSGTWPLQQQMQAVAAGTWTGITQNALYVWGDNRYGQLGLNNLASRSSPTQVGTDTDWGLNNAANGYATFFIKANGTLWAAGTNSRGTLGLNDLINRSSPTQVGALTTWLSASASYYNGSAFAIKTDGTLWSWGYNNIGQLGQGDLVSRSSPVQVGADTNWQQICGIGVSTYALKTTGTLWAWGLNNHGQLGDNTAIARSSPVQVGALTDWYLLPSGGYQSGNAIGVIKNNNTLWTWGRNIYGQLGQGDLVSRSSPVQVGALTNWSKIQTGNLSQISIKTDGTFWAWGWNTYGQLGQNDRVDRSSPVQVGALTTWSKLGITNGAVGAIKTDGTLWAWGQNVLGELGQNNQIYRSSPVQVGSDTNWASVTGAIYSFIAIKQTTT